MIPKINFEWSWIYQKEFHLPKGIKFDLDEYDKYVNNFIKRLSKKWDQIAPKVLKDIEKLSGLKWKKKEIDCYVLKITPSPAISAPISIATQYRDKNGKILVRTRTIIIHIKQATIRPRHL